MRIVIPAKVFMPEEGADHSHPVLMVEERAEALGKMIADHGIEVAGPEPGSNPHTHGSDVETAMEDFADAGEEVKPRHRFRGCMSDELSRPNGSGRLNKAESQERFRAAARTCSERNGKEAVKER